MRETVTQTDTRSELQGPKADSAAAPARAAPAAKNVNLPKIPRNIHIGDINIKCLTCFLPNKKKIKRPLPGKIQGESHPRSPSSGLPEMEGSFNSCSGV